MSDRNKRNVYIVYRSRIVYLLHGLYYFSYITILYFIFCFNNNF
jgi:hypothetical protein